MASITIRNLSAESKERLRRSAKQRGCSLEALARSILDTAAEDPVVASNFPHDLISVVEPGTDIEPFINEHDHRMSVATRDMSDFETSGVTVVNPWQYTG